jgi:hypothetical protein
MPPKTLKIIETTDESALTDEQITALKELTPEEIRILRSIATTSKAVQIIIAVISGVMVTVSLLNLDKIKSFLSWLSK